MKKEGKKIIGTAILYSIGEIVPRIISFLLLPILTKYLSPADYGIMSYTTTIMTFIYVVAALSLNTFLLRNYYLEKTEEGRRSLIGTIFLFISLFNLVLLALQLLLFPMAIKLFNINIPFYPFFLLAIINNVFDVVSIIPLVVYRIKENPKAFIFLSLSRVVLQYLLTFIFVVYMNKGLEGTYLAKFYINIPFAFIYIYVVHKNGFFVLDKKKIKAALSFSIPLLPASLSYLIIVMSDRIILERYISLEKLGIYSIAFTLSLALNIIIQALYKTFEQIIFKRYHEEDFNKLNIKLYKVYSMLVLLGGGAIALFAQEIFRIVASKSFFEGHLLVPSMVTTVVLSGFNTYLSTLLVAANRQKIVSMLMFISAIICIVLNLILVPQFGFWGSIIATILSVAIITVISCIKLKLYHNIFYYQIFSLVAINAIPIYLDYHPLFLSSYLNIFMKILILSGYLLLSLGILKIGLTQTFSFIKFKRKG